LNDSSQAERLIPLINESTPLHGLVNSAAIFQSLSLETTSLDDWQKHLQINLTAPFPLSQAFAKQAQEGARIVNIVDWRALRPGADYFPYTISKAALASLTKSLELPCPLKLPSMRLLLAQFCHHLMETRIQILSRMYRSSDGQMKMKWKKPYCFYSLVPRTLLARLSTCMVDDIWLDARLGMNTRYMLTRSQ